MVEIDDDDDDFDNFVDDAIFENDEEVSVVGNTTTICDNNAIYIKRKSLYYYGCKFSNDCLKRIIKLMSPARDDRWVELAFFASDN